jgi:hypothetical protein
VGDDENENDNDNDHDNDHDEDLRTTTCEMEGIIATSRVDTPAT